MNNRGCRAFRDVFGYFRLPVLRLGEFKAFMEEPFVNFSLCGLRTEKGLPRNPKPQNPIRPRGADQVAGQQQLQYMQPKNAFISLLLYQHHGAPRPMHSKLHHQTPSTSTQGLRILTRPTETRKSSRQAHELPEAVICGDLSPGSKNCVIILASWLVHHVSASQRQVLIWTSTQ